MTRIAILPYRKLGFARVYGFTVRDLMILRVLADMPAVEQIDWFERPGLPHEYFRDLLKGLPETGNKVTLHNKLDVRLGAAMMQRRLWTQQAMELHEPALNRWAEAAGPNGVLLDFNPFYRPPESLVSKVLYWYDLIDSFNKHNRFSPKERAGVELKYAFVKRQANLVTGVTPAAIAGFDDGRVLANRLLRSSLGNAKRTALEYDLGFIGFITNKFDIEAVQSFAAQGLKVLVCGHAYDASLAAELSRMKNVDYHGPFTSGEVPALIGRFRIGVVPYRPEMSHDESPIKFFQYVAHGRPVILSTRFNAIETSFEDAVFYYDRNNPHGVLDFVSGWQSNYATRSADLEARARRHPDLFWDNEISAVLTELSYRALDTEHI